MSLPNAFIYFVRRLVRNAAKFMHAITQLLHCVDKMLKSMTECKRSLFFFWYFVRPKGVVLKDEWQRGKLASF